MIPTFDVVKEVMIINTYVVLAILHSAGFHAYSKTGYDCWKFA